MLFVAQGSRADILAGPITNTANGHLYYLLSTNTWTGAEAEAVSLGGHLVTLNDTNENHWVCSNFLLYAGAPRVLWIGYFQPQGSAEPLGGWQWVSGESVTFTNWIPGEPNNNSSKGPQNWAMIWPPTASPATTAAEKWNDTWNLPDTGTASQLLYGMHGVVEVVPSRSPGVPSASSIRSAVEVAWPSLAGKYYRVQWADEADPQTWTDLSGLERGTGSTNYFYDTTRVAAKRFYRVVTLP